MLGSTGHVRFRYRGLLTTFALLLLISLFAAFIFSAAGCGEKQASMETVEVEEETEGEIEEEEPSDSREEAVQLDWEYTNDMYGFSIYYPDDWECKDILEGRGCSITRPTNGIWQVDAFGQPAEGRTPPERIEQEYAMMTEQWEVADRDPSNLTSDSIDGSEYAYDFWTYTADVGDVDYYYEMMVTEKDGMLFSVTAQYPVEEADEVSPIVEAIMDSFTLPG